MTPLLSRVRFLPMTIFAAALMLTVKIGTIWNGVDGLLEGGIKVSGAEAQTTDAPARATADPTAPAAAADEETGADVEAATKRLVSGDPTLLTQVEIELLQDLAERREVLESRAKELDLRAGMLRAAEERIDKKIAELKAFQGTIEGLVKTYDDEQEQKMKSLVKIYENMKPKDAARIFEDLEMDTLLSVAERMKERKLAPVMANMNPDKARDMTVELSGRRELPEVGSVPGG